MSSQCVERITKRRRASRIGALPKDLYAYAEARSSPRIGRPPKFVPETWTIVDDWPEPFPVTKAEIDLFEAWFGKLLDDLLRSPP
ncbi:MAG: hypothetical protein IKE42_21585 [Aquamicrobium sp.]|nr:hypothetical protein [Aquamicrobium sp.]